LSGLRDFVLQISDGFFQSGNTAFLLEKLDKVHRFQLYQVLRQITDGLMFSVGYLNNAGIDMNLIEYRPKQCCFAGAVFADQADAASGMNCPVDIVE
jgi:hypothetical protein